MVRKAVTGDVKAIHGLLGHYAQQGLLLPRSLSELYDHMRDFFVIQGDGQREEILGACALGICWEDLAEIRSLAVTKGQQGRGYGKRLVETCIEEARSLGLPRVFALTYVPRFFLKLGFREVPKSSLPQKIWADCIHCPKFPDCDETAVLLEL
ncbi:MAG: N-acetyltransferase [Deltaproteobacteria bacterium]|nr:N-acetyltransferase [Deltaproteobacteria bacterium]MBW2015694.1 N-acetyltransferase [Deltaproteobacteria bacterium]MBW2128642.1 N-acetyltransferase [Deltaproteobacteria bacterium]MBW2304240.1 N-acetyltransferase [Deltaproteobacteria bacterium]